MFKKQSLATIQKVFFIGFSAFLFGTGASVLAPQPSVSQGFFEYQWDAEPGYKQLKYYQSGSKRLERSTYYLFLRGKERKEDITKLTITVPDYFDAKIKSEKLSLCKVKRGGFKGRTRCLANVPSLIAINNNQTLIEISPERAIPLNKDNYALKMKIFNPRKRGMYQFQAISESKRPGEVPISTYLGTWNIDVQ